MLPIFLPLRPRNPHAAGRAPRTPGRVIDTTHPTPTRLPSGRDSGRHLPWLVLAASFSLSVAATLFVLLSVSARDEARFANAVQAAQDRIGGRLDTYVALLRGGTGLFAASDTVTLADFREYVDRLRIPDTYPGIQGFGFTRRVVPERRAAMEAALRAAEFPDFHVWPEAPRDEYHTIVYLEPLDERNRAAIGYDMYTEPVRREAMARARDTGQAAISGRVTLVQEIAGPVQAGFLIYVPVYRGGDVPPTVAERRRELLGFVYAPFRADDLFANIFGTEALPRVTFQVYDGPGARPERLLHDSRDDRGAPPDPRLLTTLSITGRVWTLGYAPTPAFEEGSGQWLVPGIAVSGLLVSAVLFWLARAQTRARRQAEERREEAEKANRAKAEFLTAMSHELRTPLNAISGYAELLEMEVYGTVTQAQRNALVKIRRSEQYLLGLINDILNYARLEAGKVEFRHEPVALAAALADLQTMTEPQTRARRLTAHFESCDSRVRVWGDGDRVQQILLNLLSNAIKFTPPEGEIRVSCSTGEETVEVRVRDTGRGIPAERLESVFDPFIQIDRTASETSQQGVGLGLAISRDLAHAMHGDLVARSAEGEGSTFILTLPRAPDAAPRR